MCVCAHLYSSLRPHKLVLQRLLSVQKGASPPPPCGRHALLEHTHTHAGPAETLTKVQFNKGFNFFILTVNKSLRVYFFASILVPQPEPTAPPIQLTLQQLAAIISLMLTMGSADLRVGGEVKVVEAVGIQQVLLLRIRFKLCAPGE